MLEKFFQLKEHGTTVKTEVFAGLTTFFAMAYIIFVNPNMLSYDSSIASIAHGVFFATCISAAIGTLLMAFLAKLPFAQAPGMGLNAFFAFTVMGTLGGLTGVEDPVQQYQMALALVLVSGLLFILITLIGLREGIINAIPQNIKIAISGGIGIFICFLGLQNAGIAVNSDATLVDLVAFSSGWENAGPAVMAIIGVIIIAVLSALNVKGSVLIGILATTVLSYLTGVTAMPENLSLNFAGQVSDFVNVSLFKFDFATLFATGNFLTNLATVIVLVLSFGMVDMFDSIGTFLGTAAKAGLLDKDGKMPGMKKALLCDAIATTAGACLGTSTVTTYVESAAGIGEGGKTGLTSAVTGLMFIVALFFAPFVGLIPSCATAPALIYVGFLMLGGITKMNFDDVTEALPGFLTVAIMPLTYSIANGIAFGLISYVLIKLFTGRYKEIRIGTVIIALLFVLKYVLPV
ncbi:MAG: NCS2 family permease [Oscillospiraceae bacterium]|nr:NCS2 family permease [Oscillospiraceae bacterium]